MAYYAVVFTKDFAPGEHWDENAREDDSDRKQHWKKGQLYSVGSSVGSLPSHLEVIELDGPPEAGDTWDVERKCFVKWHDNKALVQEQLDHHQAEVERLTALLKA
jgi:hypothetical protein